MMDLTINNYIPTNFDDNSRVWVYQSSRPFSANESLEITKLLQHFVYGWKSHGADVKGFAHLFFEQFIVLMADETQSGVSGCSTDSSVHIIKQIEQQFNVNMFDRQRLAFWVKDEIQLLPLSQLNHEVENNMINADTLYFNNTVLTKKELLEKWMVPLKDSWLAKKIIFSLESNNSDPQ
jgi:hypothetical protein